MTPNPIRCHSVLDTESIQIIITIDSRFRENDTKSEDMKPVPD